MPSAKRCFAVCTLVLVAAVPALPSLREPAVGSPGTQGQQLGRALLERCGEIRTLRAHLEGELLWREDELHSTIELLYDRKSQASGSRLRMDITAGGSQVSAVAQDGGLFCWYPAQKRSLRQDTAAQSQSTAASRWDGFANPLGSFLSLLSPQPADRAAMEATFFPRLHELQAERVEGTLFRRLRGRGAFGAEVDFWLETATGTPRRIVLRPSQSRRDLDALYTIRIEGIDSPLPEDAFQLPTGRQPVEAVQVAPPLRETLDESERSPKLRLRRLKERAAASPQSAALQMKLASVYLELGQSVRCAAALKKAIALEPSVANYGRACYAAVHLSDWETASWSLLNGLALHGEAMFRAVVEQDLDVTGIAEYSGNLAPAAQALAKCVPAAKQPWTLRAEMARVYLRLLQVDQYAEQLAAIFEPPAGHAPLGEDRLQAISMVMAEMENAPAVWAVSLDPRIVPALRRAEAHLPSNLLQALPELYLRLNAPAEADRVLKSVGAEGVPLNVRLQIAAKLGTSGAHDRAAQIYREALLQAVDAEPISYGAVTTILSDPNARRSLTPVLARLAEVDRSPDPFAASHWLTLSGRPAEAARAYERYLVSPPGSVFAVPASERYAAAVLGATAAGKSEDRDLQQRFAAIALDELPFAQMEMSGQQPLTGPLLDSLRDSAAFLHAFQSVSQSSPVSAWNWLSRQKTLPAALAGQSLRRTLSPLLATVRRQKDADAGLAGFLLQTGRAEEAAEIVREALGRAPGGLDAALLTATLGRTGERAPLLAALEQAAVRNPAWVDGQVALAHGRVSAGQHGDAVRQLSAAAARLKSAALYRMAADLEWSAGRRDEALRILREAAGAVGEDLPLLLLLARRESEAGHPQEAAAIWRRVAAQPSTEHAVEIARGLQVAGAAAEAVSYLEGAFQALKGDPEASADARLALARAHLDAGMPLKALALYRSLVTEVKDADFDPEANQEITDPRALPVVAGALEKAGQRRAALRAYGAAVVQATAGPEDYASLIALARSLSAAGEARIWILRGVGADRSARANAAEEMSALCLALLAESPAQPVTPEGLRRIAHPDGAPFPHVSPAAQIALQRLTLEERKAERTAEAERYLRWTETLRLVYQAEREVETAPGAALLLLDRARRLSPEMPCSRLLAARCEAAAGSQPVGLDAPLGPLLDSMLPVAAGSSTCNICASVPRAPAWGSREIERWAARKAGDARASLLLGALLLGGFDSDERATPDGTGAEKYLRRAVELDPTLAAAWERLRLVYARQPHRAAEHLNAAEKAAALRPASADAMVALAAAYRRNGRLQDAEVCLKRALAMDPDAGLRAAQQESAAPPEEIQTQADPLVQILGYLEQRDTMVYRWLTPEFPGLTLALPARFEAVK